MPKFFFDFRQAGSVTQDDIGIDFEDAEQAYLGAFRGAQEMWPELLKQRVDPLRCVFEIRGADRSLLFEVSFQETLDVCDHSRRSSALSRDVVMKVAANAARAHGLLKEFKAELSTAQRSLLEVRQLMSKLG